MYRPELNFGENKKVSLKQTIKTKTQEMPANNKKVSIKIGKNGRFSPAASFEFERREDDIKAGLFTCFLMCLAMSMMAFKIFKNKTGSPSQNQESEENGRNESQSGTNFGMDLHLQI